MINKSKWPFLDHGWLPATKTDLELAKREILAALGERIDPERIKRLKKTLHDSASKLSKAVKDNKLLG